MENSQCIQKNLKKTILIVEDHDALRDSLKSWLGSVFDGCQILLAKNGEEALDTGLSEKPDVVLMDIMLTGMNGIEVSRRMKDVLPGTQIVILSIYEDSAYMDDATSAGVSAYIPKRKMGVELIPLVTKLLNNQIHNQAEDSSAE
jgi:DNA-binding NarL/FixJ family response regulator